MIVFVTGATGTLGRPTVARLLAAGHEVRALARTSKSAARVQELGAKPVQGNLFKPSTWRDALTGADAILHLATSIPHSRRARRKGAWAANNRLRADGTRLLVTGALALGVPRVVYPSVTMLYTDGQDRWLAAGTEGTKLQPTSILESTVSAEQQVQRFVDEGGTGVVLRLGNLYGEESPVIASARRGVSVFMGRPEAYQALVWIDDAAAALVAALDAPSGVYDVVDDEPLTRAELAEELTAIVGRPVKVLSVWFSRGLLRAGAAHMLRSQRVSHQQFTEATGWTPSVPSARDGLRRLAGP